MEGARDRDDSMLIDVTGEADVDGIVDLMVGVGQHGDAGAELSGLGDGEAFEEYEIGGEAEHEELAQGGAVGPVLPLAEQ